MTIKIKALLFVFLLIVTACTHPPTPVVQVPTLAILPSPSPTDTPSLTPIPTWTFTPTLTVTPTNTDTITPTFTYTPSITVTSSTTFTPTLTFTPTFTATSIPTATHTFTITPRPTRTPRPTATATALPTDTPSPTFTPTIAGPTIIRFGAAPNSVLPNGSITLAWDTSADAARLEHVTVQNQLLQSFPIVPTGQFTLVVPGNLGRTVYYRLVAVRNGIEVAQIIPITVMCQYTWFFGDQYAPPNSGCPVSGVTSDGRYQPFERGVMLYVTANGLNRIYGLANDGSRYVSYANGWDGTTIRPDPAPSGRFIPQEMFNWAYYNTNAPIGSWNSALGWATNNPTTASRTIQWENAVGGSNPFYIDAPDSAIYRFSGGDSGTWMRVR